MKAKTYRLHCGEYSSTCEGGDACELCPHSTPIYEAKLINLTPHTISILTDSDMGTIDIHPWTAPARCEMVREEVCSLRYGGAEIPVNRVSHGAITGLPEPEKGVWYIVSGLVAQAARRDDVLSVDDLVRDDKGRVIGARALARIS